MELTIKNPTSLFGRRLSFCFDTYAWIVMSEINGVELHEINDLPEHRLLTTLVYAAHVSYQRKHSKAVAYDFKAFYEVFKRMKVEDVENLKHAMLNSRVMGKTITEWAGDEKKK